MADDQNMLREAYELAQKMISILERLNDDLQAHIERERKEHQVAVSTFQHQLRSGAEKLHAEQTDRNEVERELSKERRKNSEIKQRLGFDREPTTELLNTRIDVLLEIEKERGADEARLRKGE